MSLNCHLVGSILYIQIFSLHLYTETVRGFKLKIMANTRRGYLTQIYSNSIIAHLYDRDGLVYVEYRLSGKGNAHIKILYEDHVEAYENIYTKAVAYCKKHNLTLWSY